MHEANHPGTRHIRNNIWHVDPVDVCGGRPVELAWFSPDCKHFSKAKGGKPREKSIRDLAWVVVLWAKRVRPQLILLENVEEFRTWGPLDHDGHPIKERSGETFDLWCRELRRHGYKLQFRELRACDYGAPTIRKRFFMIARRDGLPIVWPEPTHGKPDSPEVLSGRRLPWRTAAEIIDWSIPCPSIFERKKPLAEKTLKRIAHGIVKFVLDNPQPFIVPLTHHGSPERSYGADQPLHTVTGAHRGELAIVSPSIVGCGGRRGQSPPVGMDTPYPTTTAKADACLVAPIFARTAHGEVDRKGKKRGKGSHIVQEPFPTISTSQDSALVTAHITKFRNGATGHDMRLPLATVTANSFVKRPGGAAPLGIVEAKLASILIRTDMHKSNAGLPLRSRRIPIRTVTSSRRIRRRCRDAGQEQLRVEPGPARRFAASHDHDAGQPIRADRGAPGPYRQRRAQGTSAAGDGRDQAPRNGRRRRNQAQRGRRDDAEVRRQRQRL
jgi:DNA (cytosine-5)-methyltransferase 1